MNDNIARPKQYYLKKMIRLFVSDTIKLLDLALTDDEIDPQISACVVWDRFEAFLFYTALENGCSPISMQEYLDQSGYSEKDIRKLEEKRESEKRRYANWGTLPES